MSRVTLLAHSSTAATAAAAFPRDEPLDERGRAWAQAGRGGVPRADRVRCAPDRASRETCGLLGLEPVDDPGLADWDLGRWAGRTLGDLAAREPDLLAVWLRDPTASPHGGQPLAGLVARVQGWLTALPEGHTVAVCGPAVVRAAVVGVLGAPATAFWRLDVAPMTATDLRGGPNRWTVRSTATRVGPAGRT